MSTSTSPRSPILGRPLSFPRRPETTHRRSVPNVPLVPETPSPEGYETPRFRAPPSELYSTTPLRDGDQYEMARSGSGVEGRDTDDGHSVANTFGTTNLMQRSRGGTESPVPRGSQVTRGPEGVNIENGNARVGPLSGLVQHSQTNPPATIRPTHVIPPAKVGVREDNRDSSSETMREGSSSSQTRGLGDLVDPSDKQLAKAGIVAASTAGAGAAGRQVLVSRGHGVGGAEGREPRGYENVNVPDKWGITSSHIKEARWKALKKAAFLFGFITIWLWICLSIFWGSTYRLVNFLPSLTVHVIPLDAPAGGVTSFLNGPIINEANYIASLPSSVVHLGYEVKDPADYPNGLEDVRKAILAQECWAAIVVNANATSAWTDALANGDASYDPTGAMGIYFASARFYQVVLLYFESLISQTLQNPLATARSQALESFMTSSAANPALLTNAARVPQAIGVGFGYTFFDVRPIANNAWAGAAPMEASLIYFIIFAFYIALFGGIARMKSGLGSRLKFSSMLGLRLGWPLLAYFFLSLWQTLVVRAWQVPLDQVLGRAGFVTLWALNYVTIIAAGFAMETALSLVGIAWLPFFLILWIILNITSSFYPIEMMPNFYRFLRWLPFVHNVEGYKIIAYGANLQHRLGLHFGVIFALIGVELIFLPLAIFFERWKGDRDARREQEKKAKDSEKEESSHQGA